jgi:hypothetical protein
MTDPRYDDSEARLITRLVDGAVDDADRRRAETWMRERPEVRAEVAAQRRVAAELHSSGPPAPGHLVTAVRRRVADAYGPAAALAAPARRRFAWRPMIAAPALACAAIAVAIIVAVGGGGSGPSIVRAAQLAFAPSTAAAPPARDAHFLDVSYGGVTFPNYQRAFGAVPVGRRTDLIGGRPALTVFYRLRDGTRLSYTVFSGQAVPRPGDAKAVVYDGVHLHVFATRSRLAVVTLVRFGRTCVLAAPTTQDAVLALAAEPIRVQAT